MQITMHLCPECAKDFTPGLQKQISGVNNLLMRIMGSGDLFDTEMTGDNLTCPDCRMTFADFRKKGVIGCGKCYDVFRERMESILKRLHGNNRHVGLSYEDKPVLAPAVEVNNEQRMQKKEEVKNDDSLFEKVNNLKKALNEAVAKEDYEEAAKIRDMIKIMEDRPTGGNVL